jgi:hypothetical protein
VKKLIRDVRGSSTRGRQGESQTTGNAVFARAPENLTSLVRGLYSRVARWLRLDPSYVSRVARGERESKLVEDGLERELRKIMKIADKQFRPDPKAAESNKRRGARGRN